MPTDALWGGVVSVSILVLLLQKARCYVRRRTDENGSLLPWEIGAGFTERPLVPREADAPPEGKANDVLSGAGARPRKNPGAESRHANGDQFRAHLEHHR